ncbi:PREDICTED: all-trans-retinol 13,14-reductase isoform X1 [Calidris pugnax]|uniref:all-trans-retinol 13,14-reductase isoform X1 n=1 Tax=Calidris pugnax TaxID=198806 RepID=UPI00071E3A84|nr:PREDICTED: all-trans-retinol 13,14-reductase isoform X1 [Calidris pugnax]
MVVMWLYGLIFLLLPVLLLLLLLRQLRGTGSDPSPFATDTRRPPAPLVTDKAARRTVVKTVFSADKVPSGLDAIVVGSGIGGLGAAALLAKAGKRVLVLEQHGKLGGCCHTFTEKGFEFDTGIHYVGQMQEGSVTRFMVDQLTEGQLEWARLPAVFDAVVLGEPSSGRTYRLYSGKEEYFQGLKEQFPGEEAAIDEFKRLVKSVGRGTVLVGLLKMLPRALVALLCRSGLLPRLSAFCRLAPRSLKEVVEGLTANPELRAVLSYIFPTYGVVPSKASFSMHSILVNHFLRGAWYPKGGAGEIAFHTIPVIRKTGGNVLGKAPVQRILLDSQGRACGVSVKKGQDLVNIFAPIIISDAGIFNTYERLLPAEARALPEIQSQLGMATHGAGGFTVFVGLNGSREELGLEPTNYFMYTGTDLDEITNRYLASSREEAAKNIPLLFVTCPSAKDPTWETRHPGKSTLAIVTFAKYEWFEEWKDKQVNKRGDDYEELKKTFVDAIMQTVFKLYPRIEDRIEYISGGTPLTNQHYIASPKGEIYGIDHNITRMKAETIATVRAQTAVPNLYLTGQDLCIGGFMGALQGALICASAILKRNLYVDMVQLKKRTEATNSKKGD